VFYFLEVYQNNIFFKNYFLILTHKKIIKHKKNKFKANKKIFFKSENKQALRPLHCRALIKNMKFGMYPCEQIYIFKFFYMMFYYVV
jgi:hypothetical protein